MKSIFKLWHKLDDTPPRVVVFPDGKYGVVKVDNGQEYIIYTLAGYTHWEKFDNAFRQFSLSRAKFETLDEATKVKNEFDTNYMEI